MDRSSFKSHEDDSLRAKLLHVISDAKVPAAEAVKALAQCKSQFENRKVVEKTLKDCGLRWSGFLTNQHLELYYDIARGKRQLGYISKGWEDPGFRVGDIIVAPKGKVVTVRQHVPKLMKYCATRGVAITGENSDDAQVELHMDSVIYSDGFNRKVLSQVVQCLTECADKARDLLRAS